MKRASTMIAETISMDAAEINDYRYQRYAAPAVYAIGDFYFAAHKTKPKHNVGGEWTENADQFFARNSGMKIWYSQANKH